MTTEQLIEGLAQELRDMKVQVIEGQNAISQRLNNMDLNGSAVYLREFGKFLATHPTFMKEQLDREARQEEHRIVLAYFTRVLHLSNLKTKFAWLAAGIAAGFLFALGNALFVPFDPVGHYLHEFLRHTFGVR